MVQKFIASDLNLLLLDEISLTVTSISSKK